MQKFINNFLNDLSLPSIFSSFLEKKIEQANVLVYSDHIDPTKTLEKKIQEEKRRRNQAYLALDYNLSFTTYFDFFSFDSFQIAKSSKYLTQIANKNIVTTEYLLLSFFSPDLKISELLKDFGITYENIFQIISSFSNFQEKKQEKKLGFFQKILKNIQNLIPGSPIVLNQKIEYSLEVNKLFEKAALNAFQKFKTPIIGTEILFLTLMEEDTKAQKILKKLFQTENEWFSLRYFLIKRIYSQENVIRTQVHKNQEYFAYLLRSRLSDIEFENSVENNFLSQAVFSFRNELISEALKIDIYKLLKEEVDESIKLSRKQKNPLNRFISLEKKEIEEE